MTRIYSTAIRAGKTAAMLVECYHRALKGEKVVIASPRGDIKMELLPRKKEKPVRVYEDEVDER